MIASTSPALDVALAYHYAWTGHDLDKAMSYIADDIICDAPAGRLVGASAYREFRSSPAQNLLPRSATTRKRWSCMTRKRCRSTTRPAPSV
jgi:hypothetical protein